MTTLAYASIYAFIAIATALACADPRDDASAWIANFLCGLIWPLVLVTAGIRRLVSPRRSPF